MNLFRSVKALCVLSLFRSPLEKLLHEVEYTLCVHKQAAKPCAPFLEAARSRNRNPRASFMNRKSTLNFALTYISMVLCCRRLIMHKRRIGYTGIHGVGGLG